MRAWGFVGCTGVQLCLGEREKPLEAEHLLRQNVNARRERKEYERLGARSPGGGRVGEAVERVYGIPARGAGTKWHGCESG